MDNVILCLLRSRLLTKKNKFSADVLTTLSGNFAKPRLPNFQQQRKFNRKLTFTTTNIFIMSRWNKICTCLNSTYAWKPKQPSRLLRTKVRMTLIRFSWALKTKMDNLWSTNKSPNPRQSRFSPMSAKVLQSTTLSSWSPSSKPSKSLFSQSNSDKNLSQTQPNPKKTKKNPSKSRLSSKIKKSKKSKSKSTKKKIKKKSRIKSFKVPSPNLKKTQPSQLKSYPLRNLKY